MDFHSGLVVWCEDENDGPRHRRASSPPRITRNEGSFRKLAQAGRRLKGVLGLGGDVESRNKMKEVWDH